MLAGVRQLSIIADYWLDQVESLVILMIFIYFIRDHEEIKK